MIILCGHGIYGKTLKKSVEMITGEQPQVRSVDFTMNMAVTDIISNYEQLIKEAGEEVFIMCDLKGGSPANAAVLTKRNHPEIRVCTGLNLSMLLSLIMGSTLEEALYEAKDSIQEIE